MGDSAAAALITRDALPGRPPSAWLIAWILTSPRECLSPAEAKLVTLLQNKVPALHAAVFLVDHFHTMLRAKTSAARGRR